MNGKGRGPMKGYNYQKYAENYDQIFRTMKTNQETKTMIPDQPTATATPETDAAEFTCALSVFGECKVVISDFARTLERELSSAKAEADRLTIHGTAMAVAADNATAERKRVEAELAEAKAEVELRRQDTTDLSNWVACKMLNAEWDSFKKSLEVIEYWKAEWNKQTAERDQLRARVAELEADKARLDWWQGLSAGEAAYIIDAMHGFPDIRAAIDAAKGQP